MEVSNTPSQQQNDNVESSQSAVSQESTSQTVQEVPQDAQQQAVSENAPQKGDATLLTGSESSSYTPKVETLVDSLGTLLIQEPSLDAEAEVLKPFLVGIRAKDTKDLPVALEEVNQDPAQALIDDSEEVMRHLQDTFAQEKQYLEAKVPPVTEEAKQIHKEVDDRRKLLEELPKPYLNFYVANKGETPLANLDYAHFLVAALAKDKGLVDPDNTLSWTTLTKEAAKGMVVPLNLFSQIRTVAGINDENIKTLDDLRDYIKNTPVERRPILMKKIKDVLAEDSSIDGVQALYIWDKLFFQNDLAYNVWQNVDAADDALTVAGTASIVTGFGAIAAASILSAKKGAEALVEAWRLRKAIEPGLLLLANTDPEKLGKVAANSQEVKKLAELLGASPEDLVEKASIINTQVRNVEDRAEILGNALKTHHALNNITSRVERNPIPHPHASEIRAVTDKAVNDIKEHFGEVPVAVKTVDLTTTDAGGIGVKVTSVVTTKDGGKLIVHRTRPVTVDDITEGMDIKTMRTGGVLSKLLSPAFKSDKNKEVREIINSNRSSIYSTQIYTEYLGKRFQQIAGKLSGKSRKRFADAVTRWTTKEERPTIKALMEEGLTKDEAKAVINYFHTTEAVYRFADQQLITEAKTFGFKTIKVGEGDPHIGKVFENAEQAAKYWESRVSRYGKAIAIEMDDGSLHKLKIPEGTPLKDVIEDANNRGYAFVRLKDPIHTANDSSAQYALVKKKNIGEIPSSGLLKKELNYTPLVVDNSVGVIVKRRKVDLDGTVVYRNEIEGYFDDIASLNEARKKYNGKPLYKLSADGKKKKKIGNYQVFSFHDEIPNTVLKDITEGIFTGKYRSERTGRPLHKLIYDAKTDSLVATNPNYKDPLEAMSEYTKTLMKDYNFSPRILADQKRFLNTVADIVDDFSPTLENFSREAVMDALNRINPAKLKNIGMEDETVASVKGKLRSVFETLEATSMMARKNPIQQAFINAIDDANLGKDVNSLLNKLRNGLSQSIAKADPASTLKAFTATMYLGLYNVRQFFTQSANILNILAISPVKGTKALFKSGELAAYDMAGGIAASLTDGWVGRFALAEQMLKKSQMSRESKRESIARMALWARTGLRENMLANADFFDQREAVSFEKLRQLLSSKTASVLGKVSKKAGDPSLWYSTIFDNMFIYKAGESWNRRVAFSTAFEEALEKFGLEAVEAAAKGKNKKVVDFIFNRSHTLMFNLDVANRAPFQHGWSGLFLMFFQVNTKTAEALFGRDLSIAEKIRLFGASLALFGRKGVTGYQGAVAAISADGSKNYEMDYVTSVAEELGISPEEARTLYTYGLLGVLTKHTLGATVDLSSLSAIDSLVGNVKLPADTISALLGEEGNGRPVLVPFSMGKQVYTSMGRAITTIRMAKEKEELTLDDVSLLLKELGNIPSSTKNFLLATYIYNTGLYRTSTGNPVMYTDNKQAAAIAQMFGFKLADIEAAYQGLEDEREYKKYVSDLSDGIVKTIISDNPDSPERVNELLSAYGKMLGTLPENTQLDIWEAVSRKLTRRPKVVGRLSGEVLESVRQQIKDNQMQGEQDGR